MPNEPAQCLNRLAGCGAGGDGLARAATAGVDGLAGAGAGGEAEPQLASGGRGRRAACGESNEPGLKDGGSPWVPARIEGRLAPGSTASLAGAAGGASTLCCSEGGASCAAGFSETLVELTDGSPRADPDVESELSPDDILRPGPPGGCIPTEAEAETEPPRLSRSFVTISQTCWYESGSVMRKMGLIKSSASPSCGGVQFLVYHLRVSAGWSE